jgi:pimeloyl-ACP methyl ester carboxylesterase
MRRRRRALPGRGPGELDILDLGPPERAPDLVFLHANGFNASTYRGILAPLADRYRILALDQRGHGGTTLAADPDARTNWLDMRDDLLAFAAVEGLAGVVLSGHSMGATACVLAAAEAPGLARRLVLFDPVMMRDVVAQTPADSPMIVSAQRRRAVFPSREDALAHYVGRGAFRTWPRETVEDYVAGGFRDLPGGEVALACAPAWEASNYGAHAHDSFEALARVAAPVEIFAAEQGSTLHPPLDGSWPGGFPAVRAQTVEGASHFLPMERPDLVRRALEAALEVR